MFNYFGGFQGQPPVSPLEVGYPSLAAYEADIAHYPPLHQQPPSPTPPSPPQGESRSREQQEVVERLLDFAARLYRQGQADAALELWAQAMQIDDTDPRLLNDMGTLYLQSWGGAWEEAVSLACAQSTRHWWALQGRRLRTEPRPCAHFVVVCWVRCSGAALQEQWRLEEAENVLRR
jgi:tetratricopeptide (TPR) repeat protein